MYDKKYAIKKKDGNWLVTSNYHNNGYVICLFTKEEAQKLIETIYGNRGCKVSKILK